MKKVIFLVSLFFLISCKVEKYKLTYRIYYPGNTVEKTVYCWGKIYNSSRGGSNLLMYVDNESGNRVRIKTTAPIEVVECEKQK